MPDPQDHSRLENRFEAHSTKKKRDGSVKNLCLALCNEIQAYKRFLLLAENLSSEEVAESIDMVVRECAEETAEIRECPDEVYRYQEKKV